MDKRKCRQCFLVGVKLLSNIWYAYAFTHIGIPPDNSLYLIYGDPYGT